MREIPAEKLYAIINAQVQLVGLGNDLSAVMDAASAVAVTLTGADGAVVELLEGDSIVYRSACGLAEPQLGLRMPVANSLSGFCLTHRVAAICTDSATDARVNREACRKVGLRAMVIVPLLAGDQALAVMKLTWTAPRVFEDREVEIAQMLANMAAVLLQRATLEGPDILARRLTQDETTGTANRSFFYEQLQARLATAQAASEHLAVGVIRIDEHAIRSGMRGRETSSILVDIARKIGLECRPGDVAARIGPYEFAVILKAASRRSIVTSQLHRIGQAVASVPLGAASDPKFRLAFQTGSALYPDDGRSAMELVQAARSAGGKDASGAESRARAQGGGDDSGGGVTHQVH